MSISSKGSQLADASLAADLWQKLNKLVKARGGTDEDMRHLVNSREGKVILNTMAYLLQKAGAVKRNCYPVKVSYKSLEDAIAAGKYDSYNSDITAENFHLKGEIIVATELVLYHPKRSIKRDSVVQKFNQKGLEAGTLRELCAFGAKYPDIQCEFPIVALGSPPDQDVPYLDRYHAKRTLELGDKGDEWDPLFRFLARKPRQ
jgi:hypothetical protein